MVKIVQGNANHKRDFHPLVDHMTKSQNFNKDEICEFSVYLF